MLFQTHSGGMNGSYGSYSGGLGATLVQGTGKDFNCNSAICFAIGKTNDDLFKTLQQRINAFATLAGFRQLVVDGFIGAQTVAALQALGKHGLASPPTTKEAAAANAPLLVELLKAMAQVRTATAQATGQPSPLAPTGTPITFTPPTPAAIAVATQQALTLPLPGSAAAASLPRPKSKTLLVVAGGIAAALAVGGVGYYIYRRRARSF